MSRHRLLILPGALDEVLAIQAYISQNSPQAGVRFYESTIATARNLLEFPEANALIEGELIQALQLRRAIIKGFPNHLLVYSLTGDAVVIQHAFHGAQDWITYLIPDDQSPP